MFILSNFHHLHFFSKSKMVSTWSKSDPRIAPYCIYFYVYILLFIYLSDEKSTKPYKNGHQGCATHLSPKKKMVTHSSMETRHNQGQSLLNGKISNHVAKSVIKQMIFEELIYSFSSKGPIN